MSGKSAPVADDHVVLVGGEAGVSDADVELVGAKALGLIRLARIGLRTPPAFVLGTPVCRAVLTGKRGMRKGFAHLLRSGLAHLESATGRRLGGARRPLLVSVRSGAAASMPGMLETLLNVGANDETVMGIIRQTGNPRLAWDSYRRLIQSYAEVVHGCAAEPFARIVRRHVEAEDVGVASALDSSSMEEIAGEHLDLFHALTGHSFPQDPEEQIVSAVEAVFASWESRRAAEYRRLHRLPADAGTAATVQAMVFGNAGGRSGSGVGFSRDPATGDKRLYLEFLFNAQGEDLVSGRYAVEGSERLLQMLPQVHGEIERTAAMLEHEFRDLQDFEFTLEDGVLYLLQTRSGKRTPWAALRVTLDLVDEGLIPESLALGRLEGLDLEGLERRRLAPGEAREPIGHAIPASIGVATGHVALDSETAARMTARGRPVILVREDTDTGDLAGMAVAEGIVTARGGRTSHAAVVARQLGKVCLVGCRELSVQIGRRCCRFGDRLVSEGEELSLDGDSGRVFSGRVEVTSERPTRELERVAAWRRKYA